AQAAEPAAAAFHADEDERPAIVGGDVVDRREIRRGHAAGPPLEAGPVNLDVLRGRHGRAGSTHRAAPAGEPAAARAATAAGATAAGAVRRLTGGRLGRVAVELLEGDHVDPDLRALALAEVALAADEVNLPAVGRESRVGVVGEVEGEL